MYKFFFFSTFLFLFILSTISFPQTIYYVDATSSNCNQNDTSTPWQSFECFNINNLIGDEIVIYVAPGTYTTGHSSYGDAIIKISSKNNITIAKDPNYTEEVIFDGNYEINYGIRISPSTTSILASFKIEGITFQHFLANGVKIRGGYNNRVDDVTVQDCKFFNNYTQSILVQLATNIHLLRNYIEQIKVHSIEPEVGDGIQIGDWCTSITVDSNLIKVKFNPYTSDHVDCIQIALSVDPNIPNVYCYGITITRNKCYMLTESVGPDRSGIIITGVLGDLKIYNNLVVSSYPYNLINSFFYQGTNLRIYNNTLIGLTSPAHVLYLKKDSGGFPSTFEIKNNIFYKNSNSNGILAAVFENCSASDLTLQRMSNNLFWNTAACTPCTTCTTCTQQIYIDGSSRNIDYYAPNNAALLKNPSFSFYPDNFQLTYNSPSKNAGYFFNDIKSDVEGNIRPYWANSTDIGAYEFSEATVRIGQNTSSQVDHILTPVGASWKRNNDTWQLESSPTLNPISYSLSSSEQIKEKWDGYRFKWMLNAGESRPVTHTFYKISNSNSNAYFYLDLRDAVENYNPNIFINFLGSPFNQYYYWNVNTEEFFPITNGEILRIWNIAQDGSFSELPQYTQNVLIPLIASDHPRLVWGPFSSNTDYYVYRKIDEGAYEIVSPTLNRESDYTDLEFVLNPSDPPLFVNYQIKAGDDESNEEQYSLRYAKENVLIQAPLTNNLKQNYPNPFNPTTTIHFSLSTSEYVTLDIYDILGRAVHSLINRKIEPGGHEVSFDASHLSSGVYICKLTAGKFTSIKKMQLIK